MKLNEIKILNESQFLTDRTEIKTWLKEMKIKKCTIRADGTVDVAGQVKITSYLKEIPIKFGTVIGHFNCGDNYLTTLKGCPDKVGGHFDCSNNKIVSLAGGPREVGGDFACGGNVLISLQGCPDKVGGDFIVSGLLDWRSNQIKSHALGVVLTGCTRFVYGLKPVWVQIIQKYIGKGEDGLIECQSELIEAGYEDYAQL